VLVAMVDHKITVKASQAVSQLDWKKFPSY